jgi:predicted HD phosphohydrolase
LHDIGHLLPLPSEDLGSRDLDGKHEDIGAKWLARYFPAEVTEPIWLHVAAKRYLCAVDSDYHQSLSRASVRSLTLQGGPFGEAEVMAFAALPYSDDAIRLRRWDDMAKAVSARTPDLQWYRSSLRKTLV